MGEKATATGGSKDDVVVVVDVPAFGGGGGGMRGGTGGTPSRGDLVALRGGDEKETAAADETELCIDEDEKWT